MLKDTGGLQLILAQGVAPLPQDPNFVKMIRNIFSLNCVSLGPGAAGLPLAACYHSFQCLFRSGHFSNVILQQNFEVFIQKFAL